MLVSAVMFAAFLGQKQTPQPFPRPGSGQQTTTPATPQGSYGAQKAMCELMVTDYTRKGFVDGRSLRLPTVSVRPGKANKAASSFASGIIREPLNGVVSVCPVPPDTKVYCAHEYAERNYKFARGLDRDNAALKARGEMFRNQLQAGGIGVPFTLGDELATNPFLRADDPTFQKQIGMAGKSPIEVFAELRRRRDET